MRSSDGPSKETEFAETAVEDWLERIRADALEMPGLRLSRDFRRFCGLDSSASSLLLDALLHEGFLKRTRWAGYARADS